MKTAVVILNWNTEDLLRKFLPKLVASVSKIGNAEVIVADNDSSDSSVEMLKNYFPEIRTIEYEKNYGFTGGYNKTFKQIDCDYFVLINSDIEVTEDWLAPLVNWMDTHPECGACAPKLHSLIEKDKFEYAGAAGGYIDNFGFPFCRGRIMKYIETDRGQYDSIENVFWATGACLMIRSSVYRHLGGLDERFFAHMEEIDLCWRIQLSGWKVTVIPESVVYHLGGGTLSPDSPFKLYLNYRNNLLMLNNNLAKTYAIEEKRKGKPISESIDIGIRRASIKIFLRKCLDLASALVYLITLKTEYFKAVLKAHKDYKNLSKAPDADKMMAYMEKYSRKASVTGFYKKSIILHTLLKRDKIFRYIKAEDFYNI